MLKHFCLAALLPAIALSGCASSDAAYPSLGIRDTERVSLTMATPTAQPYQPPATSAAALSQSEQLVAQAQAAHSDFLKTAPQTRNAVAAAQGAARDSDRWANAQVAIADLEGSRAQLMIALADLDRLTVNASVAGEQFAELAAKRDQIAQLSDTQSALISAMLQSLAP